jgi:hypothetical protein
MLSLPDVTDPTPCHQIQGDYYAVTPGDVVPHGKMKDRKERMNELADYLKKVVLLPNSFSQGCHKMQL